MCLSEAPGCAPGVASELSSDVQPVLWPGAAVAMGLVFVTKHKEDHDPTCSAFFITSSDPPIVSDAAVAMWLVFVTEHKEDQDQLIKVSREEGWKFKPSVSCYSDDVMQPISHPRGDAHQYRRCHPRDWKISRFQACFLLLKMELLCKCCSLVVAVHGGLLLCCHAGGLVSSM